MPGPGRKTEVSSESSDVLLTGQATVSQLSQLFRTDAKTLPKRLHGLIPAGKRGNYHVYDIREAAGRLVEPSYEIEEYISKMNPTMLPNLLSKEFWNGQNARIKFEEAMGRLYPVEQVIAAIAEVYSTIRMALLLMSDSVERQTSLTEPQRKVIKDEIDGAITEVRSKIVERFKNYGNGPGDDGGTFIELSVARAVDVGLPAPEEEPEDDDGI